MGHLTLFYINIMVAEKNRAPMALQLGWPLDAILFLPVSFIKSSIYGHGHDLGIGASFVLLVLTYPKLEGSVRSLAIVLFSAMYLSLHFTQYHRYQLTWYLPLMGLIVLGTAATTVRIRERIWMGLVVGFFNLSLVPGYFWPVLVDGKFLSEKSDFQHWQDLKDPLAQELLEIKFHAKNSNEKALFFSGSFGRDYYWIYMLRDFDIIPVTWQSRIYFGKSGSETLNNFLLENEYPLAVIPKNETTLHEAFGGPSI